MKVILFFSVLTVLLIAACGTSTSNIDEITRRINYNNCRLNREELIFQIRELEYNMDTTFTVLSPGLFSDSVLVCPVSGEPYTFVVDGGNRSIECPSGHGESSL